MRIGAFKRTTVVVTAFAILLLTWLFSAAMASDGSELRFRSVDTSQFPKVIMNVFLSSPDLPGETLTVDNFLVTEDGKKVEGLSVEPAGGKPMTVVLTIDTSGSMQGQPLSDAKAAARGFVERMKPPNRLAVVSFNTNPALAAAATSSKDVLNAAIDRLEASGDTALYDGLSLSLDVLVQAGGGQKNIIVLSDGADNRSTQGFDQVLRRAKDAGVTVFGVGLQSTEFNAATLERIASESGGKLVLTSDSTALYSLYASLAKELNQQYTISYLSSASQSKKNISIRVMAQSGSLRLASGKVVSNPEFKGVTNVGKGTRTSNPLAKAFGRVVVSPVWYTLMLGLLFLAVSLLAVAGLSLLFFSRSPLKKQISFYEKIANKYRRASKKPGEDVERETKMDERKILEEAIMMTRFLAEKRGFVDTIQLLLIQAELPLKPAEFIFFHFSGVLVFSLLGFLLTKSLVVTLLFVFVGVTLPLVYLYNRINKRKRAFHEQLPDMLMLIAGSLKAGYGLLQALRVASEEMASPASLELKKLLVEANLGLPLEEALDGMAARMASENLSWAVMAIKIQREVGGNLAELLKTLANTIRERDQVSRQIKVLTAEGKLSAIILYILPFMLALYFFIVSREYVSLLFTTAIGLIMVSIALILMVIGGLWFRKIVSIEI